jgi:peptide deformylase
MIKPYPILTYPEKFLQKPVSEVQNIDGKLQKIIGRMSVTMYAAPGVGLAAIQVGVDLKMLVYDIAPRDEDHELHVLINPRIVESDGTTISKEEGCLSVPDFRADVKRAERIHITGFDENENQLDFDAEGFHAIVLQHEIDHLNGRLFIDRISSLKRRLYKRKILKQLRQDDDPIA